jgi:uncharacterized protein YcaQ
MRREGGNTVTGDEITLTKRDAQWLAVIAAGLDRRPFRRRVTAEDILATIRRLGSVQLDTISVISRAHETAIWSRLGPYDLELWQQLYAGEQRITEYWAHAAAIIPREDLPLFRSAMERRRDDSWLRDPGNAALAERVLARIGAEGPLGSRHFETPDGKAAAGPWEWYGAKPEREALAHLWSAGNAVLSLRDRGFGRWWDLAERAIPELWSGDPIPDDERDRRFLGRALRALGVTTARWAAHYYRTGARTYVPVARAPRVLDELVEAGLAIRVTVDGLNGPVWMDAAMVDRLDDLRWGVGRPRLTTLLSPFDNLVWFRDRMERLWDFEYRLECYVPEPKRLFGYYNMPILHRGQFAGMIDPSYDRKARHLTVKALHLAPGVRATNALAVAVAGALDDLVRFLGGEPGAWTIAHASIPEIGRLISGAKGGEVAPIEAGAG